MNARLDSLSVSIRVALRHIALQAQHLTGRHLRRLDLRLNDLLLFTSALVNASQSTANLAHGSDFDSMAAVPDASYLILETRDLIHHLAEHGVLLGRCTDGGRVTLAVGQELLDISIDTYNRVLRRQIVGRRLMSNTAAVVLRLLT